MKLERMLTIIVMLLNRDRVTANELAQKFEVSIRTIYRHIETINLAGIPIISHSGNKGMEMINLAKATIALGDPVMSDEDLSVYISGFQKMVLLQVLIGTEI